MTNVTHITKVVNNMKVKSVSRSVVSDSVTSGIAVHQAPLSMAFSREEY